MPMVVAYGELELTSPSTSVYSAQESQICPEAALSSNDTMVLVCTITVCAPCSPPVSLYLVVNW